MMKMRKKWKHCSSDSLSIDRRIQVERKKKRDNNENHMYILKIVSSHIIYSYSHTRPIHLSRIHWCHIIVILCNDKWNDLFSFVCKCSFALPFSFLCSHFRSIPLLFSVFSMHCLRPGQHDIFIWFRAVHTHAYIGNQMYNS